MPGRAQILFLEGYLFDKPQGKSAFLAATRACRQGGGMAGIALSDPFCVDRHRADFRKLVKELDYVIGNQHEWESLYETDGPVGRAAPGGAGCAAGRVHPVGRGSPSDSRG